MKAYIVDDEPLARLELKELLADCNDIEIVAELGNGIECLKALQNDRPDVLFLDIEMPMLSGLELAALLDQNTAPNIVFVTAYDQFAIDAFEKNAVDYLLKPVQPERLNQCIQRLHARSESEPNRVQAMLTGKKLRLIPCHQNHQTKLIRLEDLEYAFSDLSGVHVWYNQCQMHTQITLKVLEERTDMIRCHRQYLVQPDAIREINQTEDGNAKAITMSGQEIPVSRRYFKAIRDIFGIG